MLPPRGKKHYDELWAEEDGDILADGSSNTSGHFHPNQPGGNIDQIDDETAETEQISMGPLASRLLSMMRPEHRAPINEDNDDANGDTHGNGESSSTTANGYHTDGHNHDSVRGPGSTPENNGTIPPATFIPESATPTWKIPVAKPDRLQFDLRLLEELRHLGFISPDATPNYESHLDDESAARLRSLQDELRKQSIKNGAAKTRLQIIAEERLSKQEYDTICKDLDEQVIAVYSKRNRTIGKSKKNVKRPGGAGGGSHYVAAPANAGVGVAKPGIGDAAREIIDRRKRWMDNLNPIFEDLETVLPRGESLFRGELWNNVVKREEEHWDEDVE